MKVNNLQRNDHPEHLNIHSVNPDSLYKEIESLKGKTKLRFSPKFEYFKEPLVEIEKFFVLPETKPTKQLIIYA